MQLIPKNLAEQLATNGRINAVHIATTGSTVDFYPVVKLFQPDGWATWLLTETDPDDPDLAYGLCDLGFGCPEIGSVRISEIAALRGAFGLTIERDRHFRATQSLLGYAEAARTEGRIVA
jgi:hypothetical protein